jgi:hypothetical protein
MVKHLRNLRNQILSSWKWLLSFGKTDWSLNDYPIAVRKQVGIEPDTPSRLKLVPYSASIVKWHALSGSGDTADEALADLQRNFEQQKAAKHTNHQQLPRPGTHVELEFAANERVAAHRELADDFIQRVLEMEWAYITDASSLWHFHGEETNDSLVLKVKDVYGVDISDIESGRLYEIFDRIAREDKLGRWR